MTQPNIIDAPQTVTNAWVDMGGEIDMTQHKRTGIYIDLDINSSNDVRVRALAKLAKNGTLEYTPVIKTVGSADVGIVGGYYEFTSDSDQQTFFELETNGLIPIIQWQVIAGTVGATAAIIKSAIATYQ